MTVQLPAWLQTGSYSAEIDRFVPTALVSASGSISARGGVRLVTGNEFSVTATVPATMSLTIMPGIAFVSGGYTSTQGVYTVVNNAPFQISIGASAGSGRYDVVILEVLDQTYAGGSSLAQVRVVAGTPSATPALPALSGSYIPLATVYVPPSSTSISNLNITDSRVFSGALGTPLPVRSLTQRNALSSKFDGMQVSMMDNAWETHTYFGGVWYGSQPRYYGITSFKTYTSVNDDDMRTVIDRAKIPDPGYVYSLRLDFDMEYTGARVVAFVYMESTTTTSFSNLVAHGNGLYRTNLTTLSDRIRINRVFPQIYSGNRWLTIRFFREPAESNANTWSNTSYLYSCQVTMTPMRPNSFTLSTSTGGQP